MPGSVIPARRYRHSTSGLTASPYGAAPWRSEADRENWKLEAVGWTVAHPDGTIGLARQPFATREDAQAWVDVHPTFSGMSQR